jgi:hypothetical protein
MHHLPITLLLLSLALTACGENRAESESPDPSENGADVSALQRDNDRAVHDKETLKAMLPEELLGMEREKISANAIGAGGFTLSTAAATYRDADSGRRISVTINDGMGGNQAAMGMVNSFTVDSEEGTKSTKTIQVDGRKSIRQFDTSIMEGSLTVVFDQSVVQIEGRKLSDMDDLEEAYGELSLSEL